MAFNIADAAPVFHSLNKVQKRALVLRDNLRWLDPRHLDTFMEGLHEYEPPVYKRINGTIIPPLIMINLKEHASRFDLGNVEFHPNKQGIAPGIYHAYLTVENGAFEMRTEVALPDNDAVLESLPIHSFIAGGMLPFFETKFKAIWARMKQINEMRQVAYGMVENEPVDEFVQGETLAVLDSEPTTQNDPSSKAHRKRRPNSPIAQHVSNKRTHIGLATIPASSKAEIFNAIPSAIKVDLFNNVITTAFPNFDNLMMAAWNVVSVYSNVGTDFPELHKSIAELKSVLQDFEEGSGKKVVRGAPEFRRDFAPQEGGEKDKEKDDEQDVSDAPQDGGGNATGVREEEEAPRQQDDLDALFEDAEPEHELLTNDMPPPRTPHHQKKNSVDHDEDIQTDPRRNTSVRRSPVLPRAPSQDLSVRSSSAHLRRSSQEPRSSTALRRQSAVHDTDVSRSITTARNPSHEPSHDFPRLRTESPSSPLFSSPGPNDGGPVQSPSTTKQNPNPNPNPSSDIEDAADHHPKSLAALSTPALRTMYKTRKTDLIARFGGNANVPQAYRVQMQELRREIRERESEKIERERREWEREEEDDRGDGEGKLGGKGGGDKDGRKEGEGGMITFLGKSVLGGKKTALGMAPVAPMVHTKKNSGGAGIGAGGVKRKFDGNE